MSFCLVRQPLTPNIPIQKDTIIFAKVFQFRYMLEVLIIIDSAGLIRMHSIKNGQLLFEALLKYRCNNLETLLKVQQQSGVICLISHYSIYILNLNQFLKAFTQEETSRQINVFKLKILDQSIDKTRQFQKTLNKLVKLIAINQRLFLKLVGRLQLNLIYLYGMLNVDQGSVVVQIKFIHQFQYEYKVSLYDLSPNMIAYQSYCNKSKPIKLFLVDFIQSQDHKNTLELIKQTSIHHFYEQITVIQIFKLNQQIICLYGNNFFQNCKSSLMIVYNIKGKYTLNYLDFKDVFIQKIFWFPHSHYSFDYQQDSVHFDAYSTVQNNTKYFQLYPQTYMTNQDCLIDGKIFNSDENYIITKKDQNITIYPKIHKKTIYYKWMIHLGINDLKFLQTVTGLID